MHVTLLAVHVAMASLAIVAVPGRALGYGGHDYQPDGYLVAPACKTCDAMSCPELIYCAGTKVKDNCGCCERCSSDLFQPHVPGGQGAVEEKQGTPAETPNLPTGNSTVDACKERQCPRFKVCTINIQGLPICTCPSKLVCDPKRRKNKNGNSEDMSICGSDRVTYKSRCHMRVANCERGKRIRRKHSGPCLLIEPQKPATTDNKVITTVDERITPEERLRLKTLEKAKRRRLRKQKMKEKRKKKKERKMKKERKLKKNREKRRRMKRRNLGGYNPYSNRYDKLIGRYTKWGRSQIRKSRI